jgi:hypothetical protein
MPTAGQNHPDAEMPARDDDQKPAAARRRVLLQACTAILLIC